MLRLLGWGRGVSGQVKKTPGCATALRGKRAAIVCFASFSRDVCDASETSLRPEVADAARGRDVRQRTGDVEDRHQGRRRHRSSPRQPVRYRDVANRALGTSIFTRIEDIAFRSTFFFHFAVFFLNRVKIAFEIRYNSVIVFQSSVNVTL